MLHSVPEYDTGMLRDYKTYCNFQNDHFCVKDPYHVCRGNVAYFGRGTIFIAIGYRCIPRKGFYFSLNM